MDSQPGLMECSHPPLDFSRSLLLISAPGNPRILHFVDIPRELCARQVPFRPSLPSLQGLRTRIQVHYLVRPQALHPSVATDEACTQDIVNCILASAHLSARCLIHKDLAEEHGTVTHAAPCSEMRILPEDFPPADGNDKNSSLLAVTVVEEFQLTIPGRGNGNGLSFRVHWVTKWAADGSFTSDIAWRRIPTRLSNSVSRLLMPGKRSRDPVHISAANHGFRVHAAREPDSNVPADYSGILPPGESLAISQEQSREDLTMCDTSGSAPESRVGPLPLHACRIDLRITNARAIPQNSFAGSSVRGLLVEPLRSSTSCSVSTKLSPSLCLLAFELSGLTVLSAMPVRLWRVAKSPQRCGRTALLHPPGVHRWPRRSLSSQHRALAHSL